jgi:hypothetical protein
MVTDAERNLYYAAKAKRDGKSDIRKWVDI